MELKGAALKITLDNVYMEKYDQNILRLDDKKDLLVFMFVLTCSEKNIQNLKFGVGQDIDVVSPFLTYQASDTYEVKKVLGTKEKNIKIKTETDEVVWSFEEILETSNGIMVSSCVLGIKVVRYHPYAPIVALIWNHQSEDQAHLYHGTISVMCKDQIQETWDAGVSLWVVSTLNSGKAWDFFKKEDVDIGLMGRCLGFAFTHTFCVVPVL
ncbi:Pyruvate kinase PKM [Sciurus carolinensis]|uniref:pyruvate kinase n=1 Tax=Sciurus carolinensis TaxID=30640 RepID=A0AA41T0D5_SCICA|nr:Pyruvate kinase PKM [Sciurus carolinensis]